MDFLLVFVLIVWSFIASFLPMREKRLRSLVVINAALTSLALGALAVPAIAGKSLSLFQELFLIDRMRGLLLIPIAIAWFAGTVGFALWWGTSFKNGVGTRPLFCLRSYTLVGVFAGTLLILFANSLIIVLLGGILVCFTSLFAVLFRMDHALLHQVRTFVVGLGSALGAAVLGVALLLGGGFQETGTLLLTYDAVRAANVGNPGYLTMLGIALTAFSGMWLLGLLPGMAWHRRGMALLPKGKRLMMRVFLPAVLFPHVLTLAAWGGTSGAVFMQKMFLLFSVFAGMALIECLRAQEQATDTFTVLLIAMALVSLAFGPAGAIPALMMVMMLVLGGTALLLAQGGVWWGPHIKKYALAGVMGIPFVSPLFVPFTLSLGYGLQIMPLVACVAMGVLAYAVYMLSVRILRAWSEADPEYSDIWSARLAVVLLLGMTAYGCWFMYVDTLSLMVDAIGNV